MKNTIFKGIALLFTVSFCISISLAAPAEPTSVSAIDVSGDNGGNISITWTKSIDDGAGGNNVSYYEILRSTVSSSGPFSLISTRPNGSVSYTDNTTSDGTPYWYKVNATDGTNSSSSSVVGPVQSKENIPPIISSVTNGTVTDSTAVITWTTDEASTSRVEYDTNPSAPYSFTDEDTAYVTSHSIMLSGLNANTKYYYVVKSTDSAGNPNTSAEFNFTTSVDITKPNVTSTNPSNGASNAPLNTNITATFSEDMNVSTINNVSFTLTGATAISGTVSYNAGTRTATFNPDSNLNYGTPYTATITTAVTDVIGNAMNANKVWTFTTVSNNPPVAQNNSVTPADGTTPVTFTFYVKFTDSENESLSNVKLYVEGVDYTMVPVNAGDLTTIDGKDYRLTTTISAVGKFDYYFKATDSYGNTGQSGTKNLEVFSTTYYSGDRIWSEGMSRTYEWNPQSFSGFYYDLDTNEGSETLTIEDIDRSLSKGDIIYKTSPISIHYEYGNWGTYDVIGFMADRYFAGYHANSFASSSDNLLDKRKLSKVLTDNDKSYNVRTGSSLKLEEGYEFRISEMSTSGSAVMVGLFKDGGKVKEDIVSEGDTFVYEKDLGSAKDIPIIAMNIDTVFAGMETSTVIVEGIFQISEKYITVDNGDEFGEMEVTSVTSSGITLKNEGSVSLSEGDDFNLMGKINIRVADSNTLRFAPYVEMSEPGTYELRGTVTNKTDFTWTPFNFEALLYDIDTGFGDENLNIVRSGRTVAENKLTYTTNPIDMNFEHRGDGWKTYQSIGFMGNTYFAGYEKTGATFLSSDRSLIEEGRLSKILIDEDKRYTLHIGNSLPLQEGYSVRIDEISRSGEALMFTILKNGEEIDTEISSGDDTFVYEVEVGDTDIPIFIFHIDQVFRGMETNSVFIDGVFQISEKFTTVEKGDSYGIMEVTSTTSSSIVMKNKDDSISLGEGDTISIMGDIKIKVADDSTVRFYPFKEIVVEEPLYLELDIPANVYQNEELTIKVTSDGVKIKGAAIKFGDTSIGTTDSSGELSYTPTESGTFTITASKEGYESDDEDIEVLYQPKVLSVSTPLVSDRGESIVISVTSEGVGVKDASVKFGSKNLGTTPASGNITYIPDEVGTFTISVSKSGYQDATKDIDITDPGAKLVFSNLTIKPRIVEPGENVNITVEAANFGTLREAQTMYLKVNGDVVVSQDLVLGPGEIVTIHFNMNRSKAGTYLVEVDGRSNTFRVKGLELGSTSLFVGGIIAILSAAAIVYSISQGTLTVDILSAKVQAFEKMLRQLVEK